MSQIVPSYKFDWNSCYPSTAVDKPFPLSRLEVGWIKAFCLHVKKFVATYPQRFEGYENNRLFETYRRQVFVFWMKTSASNQHAFEKKREAEMLEYRQLVKKRKEMMSVIYNDSWSSNFYE